MPENDFKKNDLLGHEIKSLNWLNEIESIHQFQLEDIKKNQFSGHFLLYVFLYQPG